MRVPVSHNIPRGERDEVHVHVSEHLFGKRLGGAFSFAHGQPGRGSRHRRLGRERRDLRSEDARERSGLQLHAESGGLARRQHLPALHRSLRGFGHGPARRLQARVENRRQEFPAEPQLPPRRRLEGDEEQHFLSDRHGREGRLDFRRAAERPGQGRQLHALPPVPSGQLLQVRSGDGHVRGTEGTDRRPARRRHLRHPRRGAEPHERQERAVGQQPAGRQAVLRQRQFHLRLVGPEQQASRAVRQPELLPQQRHHQLLELLAGKPAGPVQGHRRHEDRGRRGAEHPLQGLQEPDRRHGLRRLPRGRHQAHGIQLEQAVGRRHAQARGLPRQERLHPLRRTVLLRQRRAGQLVQGHRLLLQFGPVLPAQPDDQERVRGQRLGRTADPAAQQQEPVRRRRRPARGVHRQPRPEPHRFDERRRHRQRRLETASGAVLPLPGHAGPVSLLRHRACLRPGRPLQRQQHVGRQSRRRRLAARMHVRQGLPARPRPRQQAGRDRRAALSAHRGPERRPRHLQEPHARFLPGALCRRRLRLQPRLRRRRSAGGDQRPGRQQEFRRPGLQAERHGIRQRPQPGRQAHGRRQQTVHRPERQGDQGLRGRLGRADVVGAQHAQLSGGG